MQKINLTHRGPQVIECIDLFDEARYGADKLFFRKRCMGEGKSVFDEVVEQVELALNSSQFPQGGNPLTNMDEVGIEKCPIIALNRYHIPNKKFWNNTPPSDVENPYKASAAVKFSIRVHFRDDFAYIDFGCPWELTDEYGTGSLDDESFPALDKDSDAVKFTNNFTLLHCHFISKEDALQILDSMFPKTSTNTADYAMMRNAPQIVTEITELVDEDGTIIAL